jgi:nucleoid-associated protein YgaU
VLVAVLVLALAVGVVAVAGGLLGGGADGRLHLVGESRVVVHSGDTLWSIASTVAGDDDIRPVIARIQQVNGLHGTTLVPGQVLRLP